uniref:adhesion G protein-coupled receptor A1 isoform X2 n=1 Tax=Jaculus jaculus TaxID=51337 RepID=UPI001E1B1284|nr:adhesion G protein-coupled receptor A1 isoform X2 [Jaculus jaculus]
MHCSHAAVSPRVRHNLCPAPKHHSDQPERPACTPELLLPRSSDLHRVRRRHQPHQVPHPVPGSGHCSPLFHALYHAVDWSHCQEHLQASDQDGSTMPRCRPATVPQAAPTQLAENLQAWGYQFHGDHVLAYGDPMDQKRDPAQAEHLLPTSQGDSHQTSNQSYVRCTMKLHMAYEAAFLCRFYLISGGVPFIICGVTAATNIRNYGTEDEDMAYCWMAWEPSLGAFYGPAAFITLVTCVYFLGTYVQLRRHPERRYELRERTEEQQRLAVPDGSHRQGMQPGTPPTCDALAASQLQNEHSFKAQLRAAAFTLFLFTATWTFGALAVSQGHFLDMVFSCLYGAFCVTLGLFVLIHHCAKREDVWHCWWSCCPSQGETPTTAKPSTHPTLDANGDVLGHAACLQDSPCPSKMRGFGHPPMGHCKTNLQAAQGHVSCLSPATPCCAKMHCEQLMEEEAHMHMAEEETFPHDPHLHRCLKGRTKPHYFSRHQAVAAEREYAYHIPSSLDGSPHSSHTDSPPSSLEGPMGMHTLACCAQADPFPMVSQPEGGNTSPGLYGCPRLSPGPAHLEMLRRTPSLSFGGHSQNGLLQGDGPEGMTFGTDGAVNIRTGPWKNETTV